MMAADYRHIGGRENRLGRHYSRFSPFWPAPALAGQSLALRKLCDAGSNRRSRASAEQTRIAESYVAQLDQAHTFDAPIVTKIEPGRNFYPAEDYHQDFLTRNPTYPYIAINDLPKIDDLKRVFPDVYRAVPVLVAAVRSSK